MSPLLPMAVSDRDNETVVVAWIDVSHLTRECITHAVASAQRLFMIIPFDTVHDCLKASDRQIDLIVYHSHDTVSPDNGEIAALREVYPSTPLVILSDGDTVSSTVIREVLAKGACGFILASQSGLQMLVSALGLVVAGGTFVPKECLLPAPNAQSSGSEQSGARDRQPGQLTTRELEVLGLLKNGMPNKIIAYELRLSEATVKVHVRNAMKKVGSTNRTHLAMNADRYLHAKAA
jgi:DNA-binding NarL/FixJ family response regulator